MKKLPYFILCKVMNDLVNFIILEKLKPKNLIGNQSI